MKPWRVVAYLCGVAILVTWLSACAPMTSSTITEQASVQETQVVEVTKIAEAESLPTAAPAEEPAAEEATKDPALVTASPEIKPPESASPTPIPPLATSIPPTQVSTPSIEERWVELEYPERMRLGDSDVIRVSLVPSEEGYQVVTEFEDHTTKTQPIEILRPPGYDLYSAARLDGVGFNIAPGYEEELYVPPGEPVTWRWSLKPVNAGRHRLSLLIKLRWKPADDSTRIVRETIVFSHGLDILVTSFLGLSQAQAMTTGWASLMFAGGALLAALVARPHLTGTGRPVFTTPTPNLDLQIEAPQGMTISSQERSLLQGLFQRYSRIVVEREFLSGYSGARTFLALPVRPDGRSDAYTIAKIGERHSIQAEYQNYETFVKDTLPPITARIQSPPVVSPKTTRKQPGESRPASSELAALRYTFIGEPGSVPVSLGNALHQRPEPALLSKLFDTFGPNWWMQHRPYVFRLAQEYDRLLPTHLVVEPIDGGGQGEVDGRSNPAGLALKPGDEITLRNFNFAERRADGKSLSLVGVASTTHPPMRIRWLGLKDPAGASGRVVATRWTLLRDYVSGFELFGLPDPLSRLPNLLEETVNGTQSTIHGDLNLENVLIGPGGMVWLIDFAQTRDGHTLIDFAHLETELIAHLFAARMPSPKDFMDLLPLIFADLEPQSKPHINDPGISDLIQLSAALHLIATRCLFNPSQSREYTLALNMACLGALKYANLDTHSKHLVYLTSAYLSQGL